MTGAAARAPNGSPPRVELSALRQIREVAQALLAQGKAEETWEFFLSAIEAVLVKNGELERLLATLRRERIGRHSERLDSAQLALLFDALVGQGGATEVDPEREAKEDAELDREIARR